MLYKPNHNELEARGTGATSSANLKATQNKIFKTTKKMLHNSIIRSMPLKEDLRDLHGIRICTRSLIQILNISQFLVGVITALH